MSMLSTRLHLALVIAACACAPGRPGRPAGVSDEAETWTMTYYQHRDAARLPSVVEELARDGGLERESARVPVIAWLSTVLRQPEVVPEQVASSPALQRAGRSALAESLWAAGRADLARQIASADGWSRRRLRALDDEPPDLRTKPIERPADLDRMWGAFFASGEAAFVLRVIDCLDGGGVAARPGSTARALTIQAAHWSLRAVAREHPRVLEICEHEARGGSRVKDKLEEAVAEVRAVAVGPRTR
jgi:hypothetical protein